KVRRLMAAIARRCPVPGRSGILPAATSHSLAYASDRDELKYLMRYAEQQHWLTFEFDSQGVNQLLTPEGWEEVRRRPRVDSTQCFVAMSFAEVMKKTYAEAIEPAVRDDCGFACRRIDAKEYNGGIVDEIKAEIHQSRFVVADVTAHSHGVYYEAGFADGL